MYRLLVVDDEEIITDSLFEVLGGLLPDKLDVCKAYSGKEALGWMERTRIDVVLTDIRMPGMSGLELSDRIRAYWPRCRIVFLTGYSEFDYAYKAIQMPNVRYLLKTEGYDKVMETVMDIIGEIERGNEMSELLAQSKEQFKALEYLEQGDFIRQFLKDSRSQTSDAARLAEQFRRLHIELDPHRPVVLALGRVWHKKDLAYSEKKDKLSEVRIIWSSFLAGHTASLGVEDPYGDLLWLLQPLEGGPDEKGMRLVLYLEGMLELVQEAACRSLEAAVSFTISGQACGWEDIARQYERLRQLQQLKLGEGIPAIIKDRPIEEEAPAGRDGAVHSRVSGMLEGHLESGREEEFMQELNGLKLWVSQLGSQTQSAVEAYYSVAVLLHAHMNRLGLQGLREDYAKLLRLDDHCSMKEAFQYLEQAADSIFSYKRLDDRDRTLHALDRICRYIEDHLGEDVSLVRLAEVHFFNPSYLSRLFKQERGINLSDYIDKLRIRRAKEMLAQHELKIREVALLVGYDAARSFTRFFKKATGMTPQEFRDSLLD